MPVPAPPSDPPRLPRWLGAAAIAVVVALQLPLFAVGVRATADEVMFLTFVMQGWPAAYAEALSVAHYQGRIGAFFMSLLNSFSSAVADEPAWRLGFAVLHFGLLLAFARYVAAVTRTATTVPLFLLLAALQPVAGEFLPPVAFPLQNTLPLLLLVLSRLALVEAAAQGRSGVGAWLARLVFVLALVSSEYACLVAIAMLAAEGLARWHWLGLEVPRAPVRDRLRRLVRAPGLMADGGCLLIVLATWVAFRLFHPSTYDGNTMDALLRVGRVLHAAAGHVASGTIFARFGGLATMAPSLAILVGAACVAIATMFGLSHLSARIEGWPAPVGTALIAVLGIGLVTVPIVASAKYQSWCVDGGDCSYLDSRLSALALPVLLLSALSLLQAPLLPAGRRGLDRLVAVAFGALAGVGFLVNAHDSHRVTVKGGAWERARAMACAPEGLSADNDLLLAQIAGGGVSMHANLERPAFWRRYVAWLDRRACDDPDKRQAFAAIRDASRPLLVADSRVTFGSGDPRSERYLASGWSSPEAWGVWSEGNQSTLLVAPAAADGGAPAGVLQFELTGYYPPAVGRQEVRVTIDGHEAAVWTLTPAICQPVCSHSVRLPEGVAAGQVLRIAFQPRFPRVPGQDDWSAEGRRMAFGLVAMRLVRP